MRELIYLDNVSFTSENFEIIREVKLSLPKNLTTVIMGSSGCGKSTLLKIAAGIYPPDSGLVYLKDKDLLELNEKENREFRKISGFVFQDSALFANTNIYENIALPLKYHFPKLSAKEVSERVEALCAELGFHDSTSLRPARLSFGERKVISFLRAIVCEPEILYLDDPTQSVDSRFQENIIKVIKRFKDKGASIIMITHDPKLVSQIADYLVIVKKGEILDAGDFNSVKQNKDPYARQLLSQVLGEAASFDNDLLDLLNE
ncbi:MAG: ATP-binding cassette domain-containing protein [Spirochaetales bacterium]|nr:ATP-binding cassette domain-containing protein [Spirochaetales bacterium]